MRLDRRLMIVSCWDADRGFVLLELEGAVTNFLISFEFLQLFELWHLNIHEFGMRVGFKFSSNLI